MKNFSLNVAIENSTIQGTIDTDGLPSDSEFAFYLMAGKEVIERTPYSDKVSVNFAPPYNGSFFIKAFVRTPDKKITEKSPEVTFFYSDQKEETGHPKSFDAALPFTPLSYPHQDIAIISGNSKELPNFASELGLSFQSLADDKIVTLSSFPIHRRADQSTLFSGTARGKSRLVFGQHDLRDPAEVSDEIGDHVLLSVSGQRAVVRTDYFGISKLFQFHDAEHFIVSNRYHLLLLILKRLGKVLTLDKVKMAANFANHGQPFTQAFTSRMDIAEVTMLPIGRAIVIDSGRAESFDTSILSDIKSATYDDVNDYEARITSAANEITNNLEIALEHTRFKAVRVDLTAGLDARAVFCALSRLRQYAPKVRIHTADVPASPLDLPISLALTSSGPWAYDDIPRRFEWVRKERSHEEILSLDLGTYYGRTSANAYAHLDETLRISGFYGEIAARPYYARLLFGRVSDDITDEELVQRVTKPPIEVSSDRELGLLRNILSEELAALPGRTAIERWDLHYLAYRNGLHCSDKWLSKTIAPSWGPLQSKHLFKLKCAMFQNEKSIKLQLDLINELNAELALIPFGRDKDNADRADIATRLQKSHITYMTTPPQIDRAEYDSAKKSQNLRTVRSNFSERDEIAADNLSFVPNLRAKTIAAAQMLVRAGVIDQSVIESKITRPLERTNDSQFYTGKNIVVINKLLSAAHQIHIIEAT